MARTGSGDGISAEETGQSVQRQGGEQSGEVTGGWVEPVRERRVAECGDHIRQAGQGIEINRGIDFLSSIQGIRKVLVSLRRGC